MSYRFLALLGVLAAILTAPLPAQTPAKSKKAMPRTADGHPDLQGTWTNATLTPMERPAEFAGKATLTDAEARAVERFVTKLSLDRFPTCVRIAHSRPAPS